MKPFQIELERAALDQLRDKAVTRRDTVKRLIDEHQNKINELNLKINRLEGELYTAEYIIEEIDKSNEFIKSQTGEVVEE